MLTRSPFLRRTLSQFSPWSSTRTLSGPPRQTRAVRGPGSPELPPSEALRRPSGTSVCSTLTVALKSGAFSGAAPTRERSSFSVSLSGGSPWAPAPTVGAPMPIAATRMRPRTTVKVRAGILPILAPSMTTPPRANPVPVLRNSLVYPTHGRQEWVHEHTFFPGRSPPEGVIHLADHRLLLRDPPLSPLRRAPGASSWPLPPQSSEPRCARLPGTAAVLPTGNGARATRRARRAPPDPAPRAGKGLEQRRLRGRSPTRRRR